MEFACVSCTQRISIFKHKTHANSTSLEACPRRPCTFKVKILVFLIGCLWRGGPFGGGRLSLLTAGDHGGVGPVTSTAVLGMRQALCRRGFAFRGFGSRAL